ncbi:MAG: hypothetical protein P8Y38_08780 [Deltaproteobacteria bacterium]|jgi:hypothetical protein
MIDIATAYNKYKFLGYEFLTWLWFSIENQPAVLTPPEHESLSVTIGNRIVLENPAIDRIERITVKGDPANYDTCMLSLQQGAFISEIGLVLKTDLHEWEMTLKGESLSFTNYKTPPVAPVESDESIETAVLEKAFLLEQGLRVIDHIFLAFIRQRISVSWQQGVAPAITTWIQAFQS